jgi:hypothetical protein
MKKQAITKERLFELVKMGYKRQIIDFLNLSPFSRQMIESFLSIEELKISEFFNQYFNELLEEKKIFEIGIFYCNVSKTEQPFYGTEKLLILFKSFQNGK